jgi:hypothetical protein
MSITGSIFGKNSGSLGPANIYVKPIADGSWDVNTGWQALGDTDSVKIRDMVSKAEIKFSQSGDKAADRVIVGQQVQIETGLGKPYLERLEGVKRGLSLSRNLSLAVTQAMLTKRIGERDSTQLFWVKVVEFVDGEESADPLDSVYIKAAASMDTTELVFDAASQRYHGIVFESYINDDAIVGVFDSAGRAAYLWTGEVV